MTIECITVIAKLPHDIVLNQLDYIQKRFQPLEKHTFLSLYQSILDSNRHGDYDTEKLSAVHYDSKT